MTSADGKHNREYLTFISIETGNSTDNVFTIGSQSDLDAFCLNGYTEIGGLTLRSTSTEDSIRDLSGLSGLISVKGNLEIENIAAPEISFPSLESTGTFDMQSEPSVSVLLPKLRQVAGRFRVGNDDSGWPIAMKKLTKLDITALEHVGQSFIIYRCPELRSVISENLKTVNEDLVTGTLESLEFIKNVKSINGAFRSSGDISSLEGFNLEKAETVSIALNPVEDLSALSSLKEVKYFGLSKGANIKSFKGIENIRGVLQIDFSVLPSVTSCEYIPFNEDMEAVILGGLTSLTDFKGLEKVRRIEFISLTSLPEIEDIDEIKDLQEAKILSFAFLPKVKHFPKMSSLKSLEGDLSIYNMAGLVDYTGLESIESVGYFKAVNLTSLESFKGMENLKNVTEGGFIIMGCTKINDLDAFSALEDVK